MRKIAVVVGVYCSLVSGGLSSERMSEKKYVFSATVSDTRLGGAFVTQGKKLNELVTATLNAHVFSPPREVSLEKPLPDMEEPLRSFLVARQLWKKGDEEGYLDCWHSESKNRVKDSMAEVRNHAEISQRVNTARAATRSIVVHGVVRLGDGVAIITQDHAMQDMIVGSYMKLESGRWKLADGPVLSLDDLSLSIVEGAFWKGSVVLAPVSSK